MDFISQRCEVPGYSKRCRATSDQSDLPAIRCEGSLRNTIQNITFMIRSHPLEAANGNWFFFDAASAAGRFTWPVASTTQDSRKNIRLPIDHVGIIVPAE